MKLLIMPSPIYNAQLFQSPYATTQFKLAGTLDGFIDLAVPEGKTYPLSLAEAEALAQALISAIGDVKTHCLYEKDPRLIDKSNP